MHDYWHRKRVLVTGGGGFVGRAVVGALRRRGVADSDIVVPRWRDCDLRLSENCRAAVRGCQVVIHLAAPTGNIAYSRAHPASQFRDCSAINVNVFDAAKDAAVEKMVSLGNLLAYPEAATPPFREEEVRSGPVGPGYRGIALAKRQLLDLADLYHDEFDLHAITVLGANAYGPHDHFDGIQAHVIPSTIVKCFRDDDLVVWGDGTPTRDFVFVDDLAEGLLLAAERLAPREVVNIASGTEIAIGELVRMIAGLCRFTHRVVFDAAKGGGDPRRVASNTRATEQLGFVPRVPIEDGLRLTIDWYRTVHLPGAPM
jgi:GDP-L-fucose synthase